MRRSVVPILILSGIALAAMATAWHLDRGAAAAGPYRVILPLVSYEPFLGPVTPPTPTPTPAGGGGGGGGGGGAKLRVNIHIEIVAPEGVRDLTMIASGDLVLPGLSEPLVSTLGIVGISTDDSAEGCDWSRRYSKTGMDMGVRRLDEDGGVILLVLDGPVFEDYADCPGTDGPVLVPHAPTEHYFTAALGQYRVGEGLRFVIPADERACERRRAEISGSAPTADVTITIVVYEPPLCGGIP